MEFMGEFFQIIIKFFLIPLPVVGFSALHFIIFYIVMKQLMKLFKNITNSGGRRSGGGVSSNEGAGESDD